MRSIGPLQSAFIKYMVCRLFKDSEIDHYKHIFYCINKKCDGNLTRKEFLNAYWYVGIKNMSEVELDRILSAVDDDQNGFITFAEFIVAVVSKREILTKEKMNECFKTFDDDGSGLVTMEEIKEILSKQIRLEERVWSLLMKSDEDGNGMDQDEFQ